MNRSLNPIITMNHMHKHNKNVIMRILIQV